MRLTASDYRADIDGLRAVAVLSVLGFHAFPTLFPGGFVGVDVFFVISGYLITRILRDEIQRGGVRIGGFYARRILRIFPALLLVLTACVLTGWYTLLATEYQQLGKHVAAGASFLSNLVLWQEAGYFDVLSEKNRSCTCGRWELRSSFTSPGRWCCGGLASGGSCRLWSWVWPWLLWFFRL